MSIQTNNDLQIRKPLEVYCGLTARLNIPISFTITGDNVLADDNLSDALNHPDWSMLSLADFSAYGAGSGFPLDGSRQLATLTHTASETAGKHGIRTMPVIGSITIAGTATQQIPAVTIEFTGGTGTVTYGTFATSIRPSVVVPINNTDFEITVTSTAEERIEIASIVAGVVISFTSEDIIGVNLDLRSNLDIVKPTYEVSSIEIRAYYPDDISEAITNIGDDMPIWYYSGIDGDYAPVRNFYLSEAVTEENNIITIHGEDASRLLDDSHVPIQRIATDARRARRDVYKWFVNMITEAGVDLRTREANPSIYPESNLGLEAGQTVVLLDGSARDHVANIMSVGRCPEYDFYPVFVDGGVPSVRWSKPAPMWDIYEDDCGDVVRRTDRNIKKLKTDSEYGVIAGVYSSNNEEIVESDIDVKANRRTIVNPADWYWSYRVAHKKNNAFVWSMLNTVQWISDYTGKVTLYGKPIEWNKLKSSVTPSYFGLPNRSGYTEVYDPQAVGGLSYAWGFPLFPNVQYMFERSNKGGSFRWKGNPKMQPRDVFTFHRLDGTTEVCTVEVIELTHEGGGTYADITYRVGVV